MYTHAAFHTLNSVHIQQIYIQERSASITSIALLAHHLALLQPLLEAQTMF